MGFPAGLARTSGGVDALLREVPSAGYEKVDHLSVSNGNSRMVSKVSATTKLGLKHQINNVYQDIRPQLSSISLFRRDVYHVDMNYESRMGVR